MSGLRGSSNSDWRHLSPHAAARKRTASCQSEDKVFLLFTINISLYTLQFFSSHSLFNVSVDWFAVFKTLYPSVTLRRRLHHSHFNSENLSPTSNREHFQSVLKISLDSISSRLPSHTQKKEAGVMRAKKSWHQSGCSERAQKKSRKEKLLRVVSSVCC